jgi:hypothetical protein
MLTVIPGSVARQRTLDRVYDLLARGGIHSVSVDELVEKADVGKATFTVTSLRRDIWPGFTPPERPPTSPDQPGIALPPRKASGRSSALWPYGRAFETPRSSRSPGAPDERLDRSGSAGDRESARRAQTMAHPLIDRHRHAASDSPPWSALT